MSIKNTIFMALVLVLVSLFIFRYEIPEGERKERESFVLKKIPEDQVARISVTNQKENFVLLRSKDKGTNGTNLSPWIIDGLPDAPLDSGVVNALVTALQGFKSDSVIPADQVSSDNAVYGLATPALSLEVGEGDSKTVFSFGKMNDFLSKRYVRIGVAPQPTQLMLAEDGLYTAASKSRDDYREKNPVQFSDASVKQLVGEWSKTHLVLSKQDSGWMLKQPIEVAADENAVMALFREIRGLKAAQFFDHIKDLAPYNLINPDAHLEIEFSDAQRKPLSVDIAQGTGADAKALFFSLGGETIFKVSDGNLASIIKPIKDFRIKKLFTFDVDSVQKLSYQPSRGEALELRLEGKDWKVKDKVGDSVFVLQLLHDVSLLEATDFPQDPKGDFGFKQPKARIEVSLLEGVKTNPNTEAAKENQDKKPVTKTLLIGKAVNIPSGGKGYYAIDNDKPDLPFMITEAAFDKLVPHVEALLKTEATPQPLVSSNK